MEKLTDEQFREQHQALHVPASYEQAKTPTDKVVFALANLGEGSADEVIRHLEALEPGADHKPLIADTRQLLTGLYDNGQIAATEKEGGLIYNLHKITHANDGEVDPDLPASGLD